MSGEQIESVEFAVRGVTGSTGVCFTNLCLFFSRIYAKRYSRSERGDVVGVVGVVVGEVVVGEVVVVVVGGDFVVVVVSVLGGFWWRLNLWRCRSRS